MSKQTVSYNIQENRAFATLCQRQLTAVCIDYCQRIVSVNSLCMKLTLRHTGSHTCQFTITHGLSASLSTHAVRVVINIEDQGKSALFAFLPKSTVLIHSCKGKSLPYRTPSHGTVSQIGYHYAILIVAFLKQCSTCRDGCGTAYQCIVGIYTKRQEKRMHGSTKSLMESVLTGKQFCQCSVYNELNSKFFHITLCLADSLNGFQGLSVKEVLHIIQKFFVIQLLNTGKTLCKNLAMTSMASESEILFAQQISLTNRCCFLTKRQMCRTRIGSLNICIFCLCFNLIQHILKLTANGHITENSK